MGGGCWSKQGSDEQPGVELSNGGSPESTEGKAETGSSHKPRRFASEID